MSWKLKYRRPRPSQICRTIEPAILVPAHFSFPSGHATEVNVIADALKDVFAESSLELDKKIDHEAKEIAENREWAGVHYASDTRAGKLLGQKIWAAFKAIDEGKELLKTATKEWDYFRCEKK